MLLALDEGDLLVGEFAGIGVGEFVEEAAEVAFGASEVADGLEAEAAFGEGGGDALVLGIAGDEVGEGGDGGGSAVAFGVGPAFLVEGGGAEGFGDAVELDLVVGLGGEGHDLLGEEGFRLEEEGHVDLFAVLVALGLGGDELVDEVGEVGVLQAVEAEEFPVSGLAGLDGVGVVAFDIEIDVDGGGEAFLVAVGIAGHEEEFGTEFVGHGDDALLVGGDDRLVVAGLVGGFDEVELGVGLPFLGAPEGHDFLEVLPRDLRLAQLVGEEARLEDGLAADGGAGGFGGEFGEAVEGGLVVAILRFHPGQGKEGNLAELLFSLELEHPRVALAGFLGLAQLFEAASPVIKGGLPDVVVGGAGVGEGEEGLGGLEFLAGIGEVAEAVGGGGGEGALGKLADDPEVGGLGLGAEALVQIAIRRGGTRPRRHWRPWESP